MHTFFPFQCQLLLYFTYFLSYLYDWYYIIPDRRTISLSFINYFIVRCVLLLLTQLMMIMMLLVLVGDVDADADADDASGGCMTPPHPTSSWTPHHR